MADLLTLAEAKHALRIEGTDYDITLEVWVRAVSNRIYRYLKIDPADYVTSNGDLDNQTIPPEAVAAAHFLLAIYFRSPDMPPDFEALHGEMPWQVQSICGELRTPTVA